MSTSVAIVIPVYREASYIEKTLYSIEKSIQYSVGNNWIPNVILVVNNPISISEAFRKDNQNLIRLLGEVKSRFSYPIDILDYTSPGLKNGVGEARRIGMSYACSKYLKAPQDRIASLDADCIVQLNYISTLFGQPMKGSAFTLYFEHELDSELITHYEVYLRYLRWGLLRAKSPFAFYSVGSCLGTTVENYQKVGGMTPKSATEDFHFLNKLRKIGPIDYWTSTTVMPSSRVSQRVTLGTGYFLAQARVDFKNAVQKLLIPSPQQFDLLGQVLSWFHNYDGKVPLIDFFEKQNLRELYAQLHQQKTIEKIHKIFESTTNPKNYQSRLMEVLDGLETLRILRFFWSKETAITKEKFLSYAQELWSVDSSNPEVILREIREREKISN